MSNPGKLARSWSLFTSSLQVVRQHKKLLLFPLLTFLCTIVMAIFFVSPALLYPSGHPLRQFEHWQSIGNLFGLDFDGQRPAIHPNGWFYGYVAVVYLVSMFLATFANVAFYHEILKALAGEPVSVRAGVRFAGSRLPSILMWSLFAGLVGLLIKALEERFGWIGRLVMKFVGVVWSVATVFAIPVLIRQNTTNPLELLRTSATTLRKTWGETLIGYVGLAVVSWIAAGTAVLLFFVCFALAVTVSYPPLIVLLVLGWFAAMFLLGYFSSVMSHIYRCALYVYASEGVVPAPYSADMMDAAWKVKKA